MSANPKQQPLRDPRYLKSQHDDRCTFTGALTTEQETVEPAHIGTAGMRLKSGDDETLPLCHTMHAISHRIGWVQFVRQFAPDSFILAVTRAWCRERYRQWLERQGKPHHGIDLDARTGR
jgi:hypothetical protein